MKAESIGTRTYLVLDDNNAEIGSLIYEGWLSQKAKASLEKEEIIFQPEGFWGTSIQVEYQRKNIAQISMSWLGNLTIKTKDGIEYTVKYTGFWKAKLILYDARKQPIVSFIPSFKWSKWAYEYDIQWEANHPLKEDKIFTMIAFYAAVYVYRMFTKGSG